MSIGLEIAHVFGYGGVGLHMVDEDRIMHSCGNNIKIQSLKNHSQQILSRSNSRPVVTIEYSHRTSLIALTQRESHLYVYLYSTKEKGLVKKLQWPKSITICDDARHLAEISHVCFSSCGRRLAAFKKELQSDSLVELCIWDIMEQFIIVQLDTDMIQTLAIFSFDPHDVSHLLTGTEKGLEIWYFYRTDASCTHIRKTIKLSHARERNNDSPDKIGLHERRNQAISHCWLSDKDVLVGNKAGELVHIELSRSETQPVLIPVATRAENPNIISIVHVNTYILLTYTDGVLYWVRMNDYQILHTANMFNENDSFASEQPTRSVVSVAPSPEKTIITIGTNGGHIFTVRTDIPKKEIEDDEVVAGFTENEDLNARETDAVSSKLILSRGLFHTGAICAAAVLTPCRSNYEDDIICVTGGERGILFLWDICMGRILHGISLASFVCPYSIPADASDDSAAYASTYLKSCQAVITALDARVTDPIILVGDSMGIVRVVYASTRVEETENGSKSIELELLHSVHLFHSLIDLIQIHHTEPFSLITSTCSDIVYILSLDDNSVFEIVAFWKVPLGSSSHNDNDTCTDVHWIPTDHHNESSLAFICLTMQGRIHEVHYVPQESNGINASTSRTVEFSDLLMQRCPAQLKEEMVATSHSASQIDATSTKKNCIILQPIKIAPLGFMLSITPYRNDLMLWQYKSKGRDANRNDISQDVLPEIIEVKHKIIVKDAHDNGVTAIASFQSACFGKNQEIVATGSVNGIINLWTISDLPMDKADSAFHASKLDDFRLVKRKTISAHAGAVTTLKFVCLNNGLRLISTGSDGAVLIIHAHISNFDEKNFGRLQPSTTRQNLARDAASIRSRKINNDEGNEIQERVPVKFFSMGNECFTSRLHEELECIRRSRIDSAKVDTRLRLSVLKTRLEQLVNENRSYPEQEQLDIESLVINLERKASISAQNRDKSQQMFETISNKITRNKIILERMKREFWDPNTVQGSLIHSLLGRSTISRLQTEGNIVLPKLSEPSEVQNIPVRKLPKKDEELARKIYLLRLIELENSKYEDELNRSKKTPAEDQISASWFNEKRKNDHLVEFPVRFNSIVLTTTQWLINGGIHHPLTSRWVRANTAAETSLETAVKDKETKVTALTSGNLTMTEVDPLFLAGCNGSTYRQDVAAYELGQGRRVLNVTSSFLLLYHPITMRTTRQNRLQVYLLQQYERFLCSAYNDTFEILRKESASKIGLIQQKIEQLHDIAQELGTTSHEFALSPHSKDEILASIFHRGPDFHKRSQALTSTDFNNTGRTENQISNRALIEMMDGTLEGKKETVLSQKSIEKEAWMVETPLDEMTPDQRKQVIAVEALQQKLVEEKDKYRKLLDSEARKIRLEILEVSKAFDERMRSMQDLHTSIQKLVLIQQLYALGLVCGIMTREDLVKSILNLNEMMACTRLSAGKAKERVDKFALHIDECHDHLVRVTDQDKSLERSFKKDLENLVAISESSVSSASSSNVHSLPIDHDLFKALMKLYKKRKIDSTSESRREGTQPAILLDEKNKVRQKEKTPLKLSKPSISTKTANSVIQRRDITFDSESASIEALDSQAFEERSKIGLNKVDSVSVIPLCYDIDCPTGLNVSDRVWKALNELRTKKIISEKYVKQRSDQYATAKSFGEDLQNIWQNVLMDCNLQTKLLEKQHESLVQLNKESPVLLNLKQGQDETGISNYISGLPYDDVLMETKIHSKESQSAIMVDRQSVVAFNEAIRLRGIDQVQILSKIKKFRKSINQMEWEHELLEFQKHDIEEKYIDFQLIRVTKELHEVIQNGSTTTKQKREVQQLEAKLSHIEKHKQHAQTKQNNQDQKILSQLKDLENENAKFAAQIDQAEVQVQIRRNILQSRQHVLQSPAESRPSGNENCPILNPSMRMKAIQVRRKLIELTKSQTTDIDCLRQELNKMRQKTFPSFVEHKKTEFLPDHN
ncbi:unnamed protein product [Albugo candida]|uniref:Cilia- and flagella-associated protein 43 n=1 Tax=Albugo candida TaxID=65357 RepID=A0A024GUB8_9STRA|nr:unnamed protein product [Albugo candida]|eukprot:CCI50337.1 unnamed protein product [Albugo candida]